MKVPHLFTPAAAAALLGVTPKNVARNAARHGLTVVRTVGRHRRFVAAEIRDLAARRAKEQAP